MATGAAFVATPIFSGLWSLERNTVPGSVDANLYSRSPHSGALMFQAPMPVMYCASDGVAIA